MCRFGRGARRRQSCVRHGKGWRTAGLAKGSSWRWWWWCTWRALIVQIQACRTDATGALHALPYRPSVALRSSASASVEVVNVLGNLGVGGLSCCRTMRRRKTAQHKSCT